MDLVRGQAGGGVPTHFGDVIAFPVRQVPRRQARPGPGQVFGLEEGGDPLLGGQDLVADDGRGPGPQVGLDLRRDGVRQMRQGQQQRAVLHRHRRLLAGRAQGHLRHQLRLHEARDQAPAGIGDLLVVIGRQAGQAGEIGIRLQPGMEDRASAQALAKGGKAPIGGEGHAVGIKGRVLQIVLHRPEQQVPVEAVGFAQPCRLQGQEPTLELEQGGPPCIGCRRADIGQAEQGLGVALIGRGDRIDLRLPGIEIRGNGPKGR